jgi:hypothetical protein
LAYPLFHPESRAAAPLTLSVAEFRRAFPGESQHVEFKRGTSMEQMQNTAVAFSNANGRPVHGSALRSLSEMAPSSLRCQETRMASLP